MTIANMPSLAAVQKIVESWGLKLSAQPRPVVPSHGVLIDLAPSGMHVEAPTGSVRITGRCPRMGRESLPDHCTITGTQECPSDQAVIDTCTTC